jgi:hypothetical protein
LDYSRRQKQGVKNALEKATTKAKKQEQQRTHAPTSNNFQHQPDLDHSHTHLCCSLFPNHNPSILI